MSLSLSTDVSATDVPALVSVYFAAFQSSLSFQVFPRTPAVRQWFEKMLGEEVNDPNAAFLKITNDDNGELVSFAKWNLPKEPSSERDVLPQGPADGDADLAQRFFGGLSEKHHQWMGQKRHYYLEMLATLPVYQGRGYGRQLVNWGLARADQDGTDCYLEASDEGLSLYRKLGFSEVDEVKVDVQLNEGSIEKFRNLCMIRKPASPKNA